MSGYVEITPAEAIAAATAQAFHEGDEEGGGRVIVHSFLNGWIGADWDLAAVVGLINEADGVYWQAGIAGHDLAVCTTDKRQYNFEVKRP